MLFIDNASPSLVSFDSRLELQFAFEPSAAHRDVFDEFFNKPLGNDAASSETGGADCRRLHASFDQNNRQVQLRRPTLQRAAYRFNDFAERVDRSIRDVEYPADGFRTFRNQGRRLRKSSSKIIVRRLSPSPT